MNNLVTVMPGRFSEKSKCSIKRCKKKVRWLIFSWDGKPMLSRLSKQSCHKHLAVVVKKAMIEDKKLGNFKPTEVELLRAEIERLRKAQK
jgi:hypothetical protein